MCVDIRVESWTELQEVLFAESWQEELRLFRSDFAFRGTGEASGALASTAARLGIERVAERHLLRNFRKYAARDAVPVDTTWDWLALGQHHGLPTRLLDWTYSPYVALHFATQNVAAYDRDGAVWMIDYVRAHRLLPESLRALLEREGANVFTTELLAGAARGLEELEQHGDVLLFLEPPSFDERIVNQFALFSLLARGGSLDGWLEEHPDLWRRVLVPAGLKWEVRDKLDQANLTERVLFPGLDGLSQWLARHYLPRG